MKKKMKKLGYLFLCLMGSQIGAMGKNDIYTPCARRAVLSAFMIQQPESTDSLNSLTDCPVSPAPKRNGRDLSDCPVITNTPSPRVETKTRARCVVSPRKRAPYEYAS